jgi:hypothetical protein
VPTWSGILAEVQQSAAARGPIGPDLDGIRLKYTQQLHQLSNHAVIVSASGWLRAGGRSFPDYLIESGDIHALMEVRPSVGKITGSQWRTILKHIGATDAEISDVQRRMGRQWR